jgi:imidazolonepropionase-like amidohydrolase/D-arabinose 5-phosphate isomerase GutQ
MRILTYSIYIVVYLLLFVRAQAALANDSLAMDKPPTAIAFINVNVVPMDSERIVPAQTVIVRADRISEIGPANAAEIPEGALLIDGSNKYLMPGLVDMHVHQRREGWDYHLTLFIANGVTTIRNMWGTESVLRLREQIKKGKLVGPTIYTTGPIIDGNPPVWLQSTVVETPDQAARVVAEHKKAGYDFIKVYNNLSLECYNAIIEIAAKLGMPVVCHVPGAVGVEHALAAGQYTIEHLGGYGNFLKFQDSPQERMKIAQTTCEAGTWNCPTLVVLDKMVMSRGEVERELMRTHMKYISPFQKQAWLSLWPKRAEATNRTSRMSKVKKMVKALHDAGANILLGTDTPNPYVVPGFSLHEELRHLVDAGLTPYEAIRAGTSSAAECLGALDEFGTISAGLRADLILVEDNPLEDVGNVDRRVGVMLCGRWFPQSELQAMLDKLAIKFATEENPDGVMLDGQWYPRSILEFIVESYKEEIDVQTESQKEELVQLILASNRIFLVSQGTLWPMARPGVMALKQLGFQAYLAEDPTSPAISKEDLLILFSLSGESTTTYDIASAAKTAGARIVLLSGLFSKSRVREISDMVIELGPDFYEAAARQFAQEVITSIISKGEHKKTKQNK